MRNKNDMNGVSSGGKNKSVWGDKIKCHVWEEINVGNKISGKRKWYVDQEKKSEIKVMKCKEI